MKQANLESVLLDFRVEARGPKPAILERYCRQYPQYARELTDYALEWIIEDAMMGGEERVEAIDGSSSPLISRAISRLYERIRDRDLAREAAARSLDQPSVDPFEGLTVEHVRAIRDELGIDTPLFSKFRNRLIDPDTAPRPFLEHFSRLLKRTIEEFTGYLRLPSMVHARASFKADGKPVVTAQKERFEDAVRKSSLDEERKRILLKD